MKISKFAVTIIASTMLMMAGCVDDETGSQSADAGQQYRDGASGAGGQGGAGAMGGGGGIATVGG